MAENQNQNSQEFLARETETAQKAAAATAAQAAITAANLAPLAEIAEKPVEETVTVTKQPVEAKPAAPKPEPTGRPGPSAIKPMQPMPTPATKQRRTAEGEKKPINRVMPTLKAKPSLTKTAVKAAAQEEVFNVGAGIVAAAGGSTGLGFVLSYFLS